MISIIWGAAESRHTSLGPALVAPRRDRHSSNGVSRQRSPTRDFQDEPYSGGWGFSSGAGRSSRNRAVL